MMRHVFPHRIPPVSRLGKLFSSVALPLFHFCEMLRNNRLLSLNFAASVHALLNHFLGLADDFEQLLLRRRHLLLFCFY